MLCSWYPEQPKQRFTFRFYDDQERAVQIMALETRYVAEIVSHIHAVIDEVLTERKGKSIDEAAFAQELNRLQAMPEPQRRAAPSSPRHAPSHRRPSARARGRRLGRVQCLAGGTFFYAEQAKQLVDALESAFDKVEGACCLHNRLVDATRFGRVLEALADASERDNVWARLAQGAGQPKHPAEPRRSASAAPAGPSPGGISAESASPGGSDGGSPASRPSPGAQGDATQPPAERSLRTVGEARSEPQTPGAGEVGKARNSFSDEDFDASADGSREGKTSRPIEGGSGVPGDEDAEDLSLPRRTHHTTFDE